MPAFYFPALASARTTTVGVCPLALLRRRQAERQPRHSFLALSRPQLSAERWFALHAILRHEPAAERRPPLLHPSVGMNPQQNVGLPFTPFFGMNPAERRPPCSAILRHEPHQNVGLSLLHSSGACPQQNVGLRAAILRHELRAEHGLRAICELDGNKPAAERRHALRAVFLRHESKSRTSACGPMLPYTA